MIPRDRRTVWLGYRNDGAPLRPFMVAYEIQCGFTYSAQKQSATLYNAPLTQKRAHPEACKPRGGR
jgi:hypothetical protein